MNSFLQLAILFQMFSERLLGSAPNLKTALFSCPLIVNITNSGFFEVTFLFISKVILRTVRLLSLLFCKLSVGFSHNNIVMGVNLILITHTFCHPSLQSLYKVVTTITKMVIITVEETNDCDKRIFLVHNVYAANKF